MLSSPFIPKLGTNYCPQDDEIEEIRTFLVEPTLRLQHLDDEISSLHGSLEKLREERARLGAYVDAHKALISPARRLPLDIIEEIFIACLPTHRNCAMSAMEAPVLLGRICSSWRVVSRSAPRLWSRLHIVEPVSPPNNLSIFKPKLAQRFEAITVWLNRSGHRPLSISLECNYDHTGFASSTPTHLIQALLPFASRWEHIAFSTFYSVLPTMSHVVGADVPMLKSIQIVQATPGVSVPWESLGFLRAPGLRSFSFVGSSFRPLELPLSWNRLTDLSILEGWGSADRSLTAEMSLRLLSLCPQLRTCRLIVHGRLEVRSTVGDPIVELSFLHALELQCVGTLSSTFIQIFHRVSFPQLKHFKLRGNTSSVWTSSPAPLLRTSPRLESININLSPFSKASLTQFIHGLPPTLREIHIGDTESMGGFQGFEKVLDDETLEFLGPTAAFPTPYCPSLETLEIQRGCVFSDAAVFRFIKARTLKRVVIHFEREMQFDIRLELEPLLRSGLHLELTYRSPPVISQLLPCDALADAPNFGSGSPGQISKDASHY